ncbi:MAG TPA: ribosome assembly RNA-binding protein YhbY [Usitatibacter sp.]|jgi:putative YhbY family RNA-binding protein|nr:ribosome assembly RNA-binding protein YhbY [Usitatibacter sp.]
MPLTPKRRSELRADAHKLSPVVIIGDKGLTDEVLAEIDRSLKAHELIKVRATSADRDARELWFEKICEALGAQEVQEIGKILVVYRKNPQERREATGDTREKPKAGKRRPRVSPPAPDIAASKRTSRRQSRTPSSPPESEPRRRRPRSSR